jgi:hypothetical protein
VRDGAERHPIKADEVGREGKILRTAGDLDLVVHVHPAKPLVSLVGDVGLELLAIDGLDQFTGLSAFSVLS